MNSRTHFSIGLSALLLGMFQTTVVSVVAQTSTLLVDLDARRITDPNSSTWVNQGTLGNFEKIGSPTVETVSGLKAVTFSGNGHAFTGPVSVAGLEGNHARSIEVWVLNPSIAAEETMVAWSKRGGPDGSNISFGYGANGTYGAVGHWGAPDVGWGAQVPVAGVWHYLVYTYDGVTAKVYDNAALANQKAVALTTQAGFPVNIAAQNDATGVPQTDLSGTLSIAMVRIRDSALTPDQISQNFAQDAGAFQTVKLLADASMVVGGVQAAIAAADYANIGNVAIRTLPANAYASGDPAIFTVSTNGVVTALTVGSATLTVTYQGKQDSKSITVSSAAPAKLVHRYNFNEEPGATTAKDVVGTADGTLFNEAGFTGNGMVDLPSGGTGYVDLPNGIISSLTNVTFETWVVWSGGAVWQRLFDIGDSTLGEDQQGTGRSYLFLCSSPMRFAAKPADSGESPVINGTATPTGQLIQMAVTYNYSSKIAKLYLNGVPLASGAVTVPLQQINDINNWLGRSQYNDPYFVGSFDEFRIYDGALTDFEVAVSAAAGPNNPKTSPGTLQSIALAIDPVVVPANGFAQATVTGTFSDVSNVNITTASGTTYQSSNTNSITVDAKGQLKAIGLESAVITATYQGKQAAKTVTVAQPKAVLTHRYSFNEAAGTTTVRDLVGTANATLVGGASLDGNGQLTLDGIDGYADLPNGIISVMTNATFEAWVTWNSSNRMWERILDFGNSVGGEDQQGGGTTYLFLTPLGATSVIRYGITLTGGGAGEQIVNGAAALINGQQTHVILVYNYSGRMAKMYVNGQLVGTQTVDIPLKSIQDVNNWLGRSQFNDPYFTGSYNEFRIYEGALTDLEIALSAAAGTEVIGANPGTLQKVRLAVSTNTFVIGSAVPVAVMADYQNVTNVNVTTQPETIITSSNPKVLVVRANGQLDAIGAGTSSIIGTWQGKSGTNTLTVIPATGMPVQPVLVHRYSFADPAGSTKVKDTAGTADGTLFGAATLTGSGQVNLAGSDGYVDLPNGIISVLTNATFEAWVTWNGGNVWQRIFDFGSNSAGEDAQGTGTTYLFLTPESGALAMRFGITITGGGAGEQMNNGPAALDTGTEKHVVLSYDFTAGSSRMYVDGQRVGTAPVSIALSAIQDVNNWLGRSNWPDPFFAGQYNEFRIWSGAMLDAEVASSFAAGPNTLPSEQVLISGIARSGANVVITWPVSAAGFVLETSAQLNPAGTWSTVNTSPVVENGQNKVTVPASGAASYYRLRK